MLKVDDGKIAEVIAEVEDSLECDNCGWKGPRGDALDGEYIERDENAMTTYWDCPVCGSTLDSESIEISPDEDS